MRSIKALEDWATTGPAARRVITWLLFWPLLLALRVPVSSQHGGTVSVSVWLETRSGLPTRPSARAEPDRVSLLCSLPRRPRNSN
jgi:hypothetical protein